MSIGDSDIETISKSLSPLIGLAPWRVQLGHGSFVTLDFGREVSTTKEARTRGEWHLWIYASAWRIDSDREIVAGSEDSREDLPAILERLAGKILESIIVLKPSLGLEMSFGDMTLRVFPVYSGEAE